MSAITADAYGYVTLTWGSSGGSSGFLVLAPNGGEEEDGGEALVHAEYNPGDTPCGSVDPSLT